MTLHKKISDSLNQSKIIFKEEELKKTDIIEYMILEAAGILFPLKDTDLVCTYKASYNSQYSFTDHKPRSTIKLNLKGIEWSLDRPITAIKESEINKFLDLANSIHQKYNKSTPCHPYNALYEVIMLDEDIKMAINSSSIFLAAGDLSNFDLNQLLLLQKKLPLYNNVRGSFNHVVNALVEKINFNIKKRFSPELVKEGKDEVENHFKAFQKISEQERKFNLLFATLENKITQLSKKAMTGVVNPEYVSGYDAVAGVAQKLALQLKQAQRDFFSTDAPLTVHKVSTFENACKNALDVAKDEFAKFRDGNEWYNELNPTLKEIIKAVKALAGVFALLFFGIGAVLTEKFAPQGYHGTFFQTKTDSLVKLESFEKGICGKDGIITVLNDTASTLELR
ncbi:MAG: hypothetical protein H0U57_02030 [Tatlockia sp.]|nr:hypothetical protein [Tatlockia sp.]